MPGARPSRPEQVRGARRVLTLAGAVVIAALAAGPIRAETLPPDSPDDPRALAHGVAAVADPGGGWRLFVSLAAAPPDAAGNWRHDVLTGLWQPGQGAPDLTPLIASPEAQEPVAAARGPQGRVLVTFEDGWDTPQGVTQHFALYDAKLTRRGELAEVLPGGHSGHVAATATGFVVALSEGWIDGGGVDGLGTGAGVQAVAIDAEGRVGPVLPLAEGRDGWPLVAALPGRAAVVWQTLDARNRFHLRLAVIDPGAAGVIAAPDAVLPGALRPYAYDVAAVPELDRFLVTGTGAGGCAQAALIDGAGRVTARLGALPPTLREGAAHIAGRRAFLPGEGGQVTELALSAHQITARASHQAEAVFGATGTLGLPEDARQMWWASLHGNRLALIALPLDRPAPVPPCR